MLKHRFPLVCLLACVACSAGQSEVVHPPSAPAAAIFCTAEADPVLDLSDIVFPDTLVRQYETPVSATELRAEPGSPFAASRPWFAVGEGISFGGVRYSRIGLVARWSTTLDPAHGEVYVRAGEVDGVPVYVQGGRPSPPARIYLAAGPPCHLQMYVDDRELS